MSPKSYSGGSSVCSDDRFSSTSSSYSITYTKLPKKQPLSIRFLSWAAGAPSGATAVKRKTRERDIRDDRSTRSGGSSYSYWSQPETQLYWVASPHSGNYYGSGSSSTSGRSSRSGRSRKSGGSGSRKHFEGAVPRPQPPPPVPANGHFVPPQPPMNPPPPPGMGGFGPGPGGFVPPPPMHMPHPPPPPHGMAPPAMPGGAPFIDLTGQNHQGGYSPDSESYYSSDEEE
ncbi:uncharacterized protein NECHADRAFT_76854 [Fusarium vanettenii 77-13-4]|uniref:Uncharacterized protein n=1 Tax=Fusarium vanettenii (strain ATCC MYA-4622 / CBS 123669 / FGSC 9596 / NRRL 45880 / 77-13-4) TaxID=660122 RepID=C7Z5G0_FUSV7|nr:uncharacterized protein NECHADRAFT_76854 [Fusarium vanettenii 77-13-4]EEU40514.1 predicted protein [Fusarium vanettenii 77-13-4]